MHDSGARVLDLVAWRALGVTRSLLGHRIFQIDSDPGDSRVLPVLVLVHGFPTASWDFAKLWPALTRDFRVIAADMLGFGFSAKPSDHRYSIFEQADLFEALVTERGIERYHVLAHDYGDILPDKIWRLASVEIPRLILALESLGKTEPPRE